jgi:hypothetical protein
MCNYNFVPHMIKKFIRSATVGTGCLDNQSSSHGKREDWMGKGVCACACAFERELLCVWFCVCLCVLLCACASLACENGKLIWVTCNTKSRRHAKSKKLSTYRRLCLASFISVSYILVYMFECGKARGTWRIGVKGVRQFIKFHTRTQSC